MGAWVVQMQLKPINEKDIKKESDDSLYSMRDRLYSMMKCISPYSKEFYEVVNEYNEICRELYVRNHGIDKD